MVNQSQRFTLKLWQYIIIAQTILGSLTLGFVIFSFFLNQKVLFEILMKSSQHIFNDETRSQLNYNWVQQNHIQYSIEYIFEKNEKVARMQEIISKFSDFQTIPPNPCLQDYRYVDSYCFISSFCYAIFNESAKEQNNLELIFNLTSILTQYRPLLQESNTYYTIDDGSKFFTIYKGIVFPQNYDPQERAWYLTYEKSEQKDKIFGDAFVLFSTKEIRIPLIAELKYENEHQGVIVSELNLKSEIHDSENLNMLIYIIDQQGMIVYGKQYLNIGTPLFYIYDTNYTGFNQSDWTQMQMYISGHEFNNTCQNPYLPLGCLCLYNSLENNNLILQILPIRNSPYFLFTYKYNDTTFEKQNELFQTITQQLNNHFNEDILIFLLAYLVITFVSYIVTQIIMEQTNLVIQYTNSKSSGKFSKFHSDNILDKLENIRVCSETINKIFESLQNLLKLSNNGSQKQSSEKISIELIQYPEQIFGIRVYLSHISQIIEYQIFEANTNPNKFSQQNQGTQFNDLIQFLKKYHILRK